MRKLLTWIVRIAVILLLIKIVWWSWERYQSGGIGSGPQEVRDADKVCRVTNPDLGTCVCVHRQTNERLKLPYEECQARAKDPYH